MALTRGRISDDGDLMTADLIAPSGSRPARARNRQEALGHITVPENFRKELWIL
jgi:hypothetical protein